MADVPDTTNPTGGKTSIKDVYEKHKTAAIVIGAAVVGFIGYSFLRRGSSAAAATGTSSVPSASAGTVSPSQYLIPYSAYYGAGAPSGGSVGTSTTSTSATSPSAKVSSSSGNSSTTSTTTTQPTTAPRSTSSSTGGYTPTPTRTVAPTTTSNTYAALTKFAAAQQINRQGGQVYWKAANGVMELWNPKKGGAPTGSTLYVSSA